MMMVLLGRCGTSLVPGRSQLSSQSDDKWTRPDGTNVDKDSSHLAAFKVPWRRCAVARLEARGSFTLFKWQITFVTCRSLGSPVAAFAWLIGPKQSLAAGRSRVTCPRACCIDLSVKLMLTFIINLQIDNERSHLMCRIAWRRLSNECEIEISPTATPTLHSRPYRMAIKMQRTGKLFGHYVNFGLGPEPGQEVPQTHFKI